MVPAEPAPDFATSSAVAALELLAAPAPARVVAADLVALVRHSLLGDHRASAGVERTRGHADPVAAEHRAGGCSPAGRGYRLGPRERLVLVGEPAPVEGLGGLGLLERVYLLDLDLGVEERANDLLADLRVQLFEHPVPLGRVLDERVLLGHRAQVHALAQVVHVLQVLAPARV